MKINLWPSQNKTFCGQYFSASFLYTRGLINAVLFYVKLCQLSKTNKLLLNFRKRRLLSSSNSFSCHCDNFTQHLCDLS